MNRPFGVPALAGPDRLKAGLQTSVVPTDRFMVPMHSKNRMEAFPERGSAVVERNRFRADQMNAAVDRGQIYRRAAFAEFAVEVLSDRKMFFRLE